MGLTNKYALIDAAIRAARKEARLTATEMKVLLAVGDGDDGDGLVSDQLEDSVTLNSTAVRRALGVLYSRRLVKGVGSDGGPRRPGIRSRLCLTSEGCTVHAAVYRWHEHFESRSLAVAV